MLDGDGRAMGARGCRAGSGALPWRRAHGHEQGHAVGGSGLVWSLPEGTEGREERVGRGNGLGGRLGGLLDSMEQHGVATVRLLPECR